MRNLHPVLVTVALACVTMPAVTSAPPANVTVERSVLAGNDLGILANGDGAMVQIADSTISGHAIGVSAILGGKIASYGNNRFTGNVSDGGPLAGLSLKQTTRAARPRWR